METGIELIAKERQEQIEKHGRTLESDVIINGHGEMKQAARYLLGHRTNSEYPRNWSSEWQFKFDSKTPLEKLVTAGALIAAEIDRLQAS